MTLDELWQLTLGEMELRLSRANFVTWLKNSRLVSRHEGTFVVALPNGFTKAWVEDKYQKHLLGIIRNHDSSVKTIEFVVASDMFEGSSIREKTPSVAHSISYKKEATLSLDLRTDPETCLNSRYTLQSFVVGPSNELAYAAACAIAQEVGTKYNPFFVYGGVGLGKTHLLQAIGNEIRSRYGNAVKPKYVPSEKFTSDVVWAIRNKRMEDMKRKYRDCDVLIVDDVQFIGGKEKTEEEFFHTFNALYENNKQIIISSDRPPQAIPTLEERLRSRFGGGLIVDITYPEYETRVAIVKSKLQEMGVTLSDRVIDIIARGVKRNIRELEGVVNKIVFSEQARGGVISEKEAREIIEKSLQSPTRRITDTQVIAAVAEFFHLSSNDLTGRGRKKEVVEPRQIAMYLLREVLELSYPYIGKKFGRDHTTVIHSVEKITQEVNRNSPINQKISSIVERFSSDAAQ